MTQEQPGLKAILEGLARLVQLAPPAPRELLDPKVTQGSRERLAQLARLGQPARKD